MQKQPIFKATALETIKGKGECEMGWTATPLTFETRDDTGGKIITAQTEYDRSKYITVPELTSKPSC